MRVKSSRLGLMKPSKLLCYFAEKINPQSGENMEVK